MCPALHSALVHAKDPEALSLGGGSEARSRYRITTQWDGWYDREMPKVFWWHKYVFGFYGWENVGSERIRDLSILYS